MTSSFSLAQKQLSAHTAYSALSFSELKYGLDIQAGVSFLEIEQRAEMISNVSTPPFYQILEEGIIFCDISTAFARFPEKMNEFFGALLNKNVKMEMLHLSKVKEGVIVVIPANVKVETPIPLPIFASAAFSHILILAGPHSHASFIQSESNPHSLNEPGFQSAAVEIFAEEGARISYIGLQDFPEKTIRFAFKRASVQKNARVDWFWGEFGSQFVKADVTSTLHGENAATHNTGVFAGDESQIFDIEQAAHHTHPHTHSTLLSRGVMGGHSKVVYHGLLKMVKEAKGSVGNQRADVLLLSPRAEADPVPALEIEGSDVRCSHAATVGRIDTEKLFYLSSRGLPEYSARALYIQGFLEHVLGQFPPSSTVQAFRFRVAQKLHFGLDSGNFISHSDKVMA